MNPHYKKKSTSIAKNRIIFGRKPLIEALQSGTDIEKIFILNTATGEEIQQIRSLAKVLNITISYVPIEKLHRFTNSNHQGVVAIAGLITYQPLQEIISQIVDQGKSPLLLLLDGITDTRNLGAIARSAQCFGVDAIIIPSNNSAPITEDAIKTSAGALELLPICRVGSIEEAIQTLQLNGVLIYASSLKASTPLEDVDFSSPIAIVMGAEDKGVSNIILQKADVLFNIPMTDQFDSLNVAVASGITLYEAYKNRQHSF